MLSKTHKLLMTLMFITAVSCSACAVAKTVFIDTLELENFEQDYNTPGNKLSVEGKPISIAGRKFANGIGTHAKSKCVIELDGKAVSFTAYVGVDDEMAKGRGSVQFKVVGDGRILYLSEIMASGDKARHINIADLNGVKYLELIVTDAGNGIGQDHADWADAQIVYASKKPRIINVDQLPQLPRPVSPTNRAQARAALIPYPQKIEWKTGRFMLKERDTLPQVTVVRDVSGVKGVPAGKDDESYRIAVTSDRINVLSKGPAGFDYAMGTLKQLIQEENGKQYIPCCEITDWPAFKYRGVMHDTGRNFQNVELLKKQIDVLAMYKLNVFHWHLTDNPGYRIECKKYPQLNDAKNYRQTRQPGKFYTYAQINEIVDYCQDRHILVIPEIDMPGHSEYFTNTFGVDMQSEKGMSILSDILNEFFDNVDLPMLHIGSDEVHIKNKDFMPTMTKLVRGRSKKVIVWRPGHLPDEDVITQLWTGAAKPIAGVAYLDSQANYINHMDAFVGPVRAFFQQPCRVVEGTDDALGGILCHWPDNNINEQMDIYRQSPVMPAIVAYAERIWRGSVEDRYDLWAKLPDKNTEAHKEFAEFEKDMIVHRDRYFADWPFPYVRQSDIAWKLIGPFDHSGDMTKKFPVEDAVKPEYTVDGKTYKWMEDTAYGGTIHIKHFFGFPSPVSAKRGTVYGLSYIHSDTEQTVDMWIGFHGWSRAGGRRGGPTPKQGQWHTTDAKIWVNEKAIAPPIWNQPGLAKSTSEIPFVDEDYFYRKPTKVKLNKGWNKVLVKAPHGGTSWKWMFTTVPIKMENGRVRELKTVKFATELELEKLMAR